MSAPDRRRWQARRPRPRRTPEQHRAVVIRAQEHRARTDRTAPTIMHVYRFLALDPDTGAVLSPYASREVDHWTPHGVITTATCATPERHAPGEGSPARKCECGVYAVTPVAHGRVARIVRATHSDRVILTSGTLQGPILPDPTDAGSVRGRHYTAHSATVTTEAAAEALRAAPGGWDHLPTIVRSF